jgi:hypothetical protein
MSWSIVVPFSKPACLEITLANAFRQHKWGQDFTLILVKNGDGKKAVVPNGLPFPVIELESAKHQSSARNTGLDFVCFNDFSEKIALWDCDDYYGPAYLAEQEGQMKPGRLVGKRMGFVSDERGLFLVNADWRAGLCPDITGACYCLFTVDATSRFPIMPIGEDTLFAYEWSQRGEVYATGIHNYCYIRGHQNTWATNLRRRLMRGGITVNPLGCFDPAVINGEKPWDYAIRRQEQSCNVEPQSFQGEP